MKLQTVKKEHISRHDWWRDVAWRVQEADPLHMYTSELRVGKCVLQRDFGHLDVHGNSSVFERRRDEAAER